MAKRKRLPRYETCFYKRKRPGFLIFFNRYEFNYYENHTYEFIFLDPQESFVYRISQGYDCIEDSYKILQTCFDKVLDKWTYIGLHQISNDKIPLIISELSNRITQLENLASWGELNAYSIAHNFSLSGQPLYGIYRNLRRNPKKLIFKINQFISKVIELLETNYRAGKTFWLSAL